MDSFSERQGIKPKKSKIQSDSMDAVLRTELWDAFSVHCWNRFCRAYKGAFQCKGSLSSDAVRYQAERNVLGELLAKLWKDHLKLDIDRFSLDIVSWNDTRRALKDHFFRRPWYHVYEFIEFVANNCQDGTINHEFMKECNVILEREASAYRFINGIIAPIISEVEISEIEAVLKSPILAVQEHLNRALEMLSDMRNPDYRNSIKESISAVEALCIQITGNKKAVLGQALKEIENRTNIALHPALKDAYSKLYGYTSDADGIRHCLMDESNLDSEDATFMLVACSTFINYLTVKASKAGINLR